MQTRTFAIFALILATLFLTTNTPAQSNLRTVQPALRKQMTKTPLTRGQLLNVLRDGHIAAFGTFPNETRLLMGWSQVALENGSGAFVFNKNLGNIVPTRQDHPYYYNPGDKHVYRHFEDFTDSAVIYWKTVAGCRPAIVAFDHGDVAGASVGLRACHYYEAEVSEYSVGFEKMHTYAMAKLEKDAENEQQERERRERINAEIRSLVGATAGPH